MNTAFWIRNNSFGESKLLNSTVIDIVYAISTTFSHLSDSPPEDKFPYTYQCLVIGVCCKELRSKYKTVDLLLSTMVSLITDSLASPATTNSAPLGTKPRIAYYTAQPTTVMKVPHTRTDTTLHASNFTAQSTTVLKTLHTTIHAAPPAANSTAQITTVLKTLHPRKYTEHHTATSTFATTVSPVGKYTIFSVFLRSYI